MKLENKHIIAIDFLLVVGTLFGIVMMFGYASPLAISPIEDYVSSDNSVLFSFEKANKILIDDNLEFSSPQEIYVEDNLVINLEPGVYYWKPQGVLSGVIRKLTITSEVALKLKKGEGEQYKIVNAGNTLLNVDIYENENLTGSVVLDIDETSDVSGNKFIGRENE